MGVVLEEEAGVVGQNRRRFDVGIWGTSLFLFFSERR